MNGLFILGIAAAGCAIGSLWLHRIISADPEPDQRAWRYRDVRAVALPSEGDGLTPGQRGRRIGRVLIALAVGLVLVTVVEWIAAPRFPGGVSSGWLDQVSPLVAVIGVTIGLVWMIRIHRADPEPDPRAWRYRELD